jgi:septum formation protein
MTIGSRHPLAYHAAMQPTLILASTSPQRKTLLASLGLPFEVIPSTVDEEAHPEKDPEARALQLARFKAHDVATRFPGRYVIGCDTLVVDAYGHLLEKPAGETEARGMLKLQGGGTSVVHSGICVIDPSGAERAELSSSFVWFRSFTDRDIDWWIGTGLWQGRSGAFQIDGPGQLMIEHVEGDWTGIVGLPVYQLGVLLTEAGYPLYS